MSFDVRDCVKESNRIEGIHRDPTDQEIKEFVNFVDLDEVTIESLKDFVNVYQPGAVLRIQPGHDVRVGNHTPPPGGPRIAERLQSILDAANHTGHLRSDAWRIHLMYEDLHPFTDGNGRSGRMLWYWMMNPWYQLGFLHHFYYQTLQNS